MKNPPPALGQVAATYPEETRFLAQVFGDTTTSYKYFWFLALLSLLKRTQRHSFGLAELSGEMAVAAWHPVNLFRLSLGLQDKLQDAVKRTGQSSGISPSAPPEKIRDYLTAAADQQALRPFHRFVPTRFLTPWFTDRLRGIPDARRTPLIRELARASQQTARPSPYFLEGDPPAEVLTVNKAWGLFLRENLGVVQSFAEHALAQYLQARNPNVPGIVNKLGPPAAVDRNLGPARQQLRALRIALASAGRAACFRDIYTGNPLTDDGFAVDHFLPWSFVAHNQFWNLAPTAPPVNSSKGDSLPHLGLYLPRLARFHFALMGAVKLKSRFREDYTDGFREDIPALLSLGETGLVHKYRELIEPQELVARNLGFGAVWQYRP